jgi:hypothetical protein
MWITRHPAPSTQVWPFLVAPPPIFIYAANFHAGIIEVYSGNFAAATLPGFFVDPAVPAGFAPFNIQNLGGKLYEFVEIRLKQDTSDMFWTSMWYARKRRPTAAWNV